MNYIVLKFKESSMIDKSCEYYQMLKWCLMRGFDWEQSKSDFSYLVKFERNNKTLEFIKTFLEPKFNHALPMESLNNIPGVEIVSLS